MEYHPVLSTPSTTDGSDVNNNGNKWSHLPVYKDCPESCLKGTNNYTLTTADTSARDGFRLTPDQIKHFHSTGTLVLKSADIWSKDELKLLIDSANVMNEWSDLPGGYMKYYEQSKNTNNKILCRIENFLQYNPGLNYICNGEKLLNSCSDLFGEQSILYKEKINYKLPGGAGFVPHQDVAAGWWMYGQSLHISVLVCIDPATVENGCLEVVYGKHKEGMMCDPWKELSKETEDTLEFHTVETQPGDVIFFDSYVPHRSAPNKSNKPRRVLYATYAKASEGDFRERYYYDKRQSYPPDCEREPGKIYEYKV